MRPDFCRPIILYIGGHVITHVHYVAFRDGSIHVGISTIYPREQMKQISVHCHKYLLVAMYELSGTSCDALLPIKRHIFILQPSPFVHQIQC